MAAVFGWRSVALSLEELAEEGLGGETELVGNLLNGEAGCFEVALCLAHQVVGDDLLGMLADDVVCDL